MPAFSTVLHKFSAIDHPKHHSDTVSDQVCIAMRETWCVQFRRISLRYKWQAYACMWVLAIYLLCQYMTMGDRNFLSLLNMAGNQSEICHNHLPTSTAQARLCPKHAPFLGRSRNTASTWSHESASCIHIDNNDEEATIRWDSPSGCSVEKHSNRLDAKSVMSADQPFFNSPEVLYKGCKNGVANTRTLLTTSKYPNQDLQLHACRWEGLDMYLNRWRGAGLRSSWALMWQQPVTFRDS